MLKQSQPSAAMTPPYTPRLPLQLSRWWLTLDKWTLASLGILIVIGILLNFAATPLIAKKLGYPPYYLLQKQLLFLIPSVIIIVVTSMVPVTTLRSGAFILLGIFTLLLVATFFWGSDIKGARRWLNLWGVSLQPSEFIKPLFAICCAWLYAQSAITGDNLGRYVASGICLALVSLLLLQPDLGMAFMVAMTWLLIFFFAGLPIMYIVALGTLGIMGLVGAYLFLPHVTSRVDRFLDPQSGDNYQINKSLEAFTSGGLFGRGPGEGIIKAHIPDAHADFIFAVAGEEFGLFLCLFVVGLYGFIIVRCLWRLYAQDNVFALLAGAALCLQFGIQAFVNMASTMRLIPTKGMTLPFLSYGGSSLLALSFGMGLLLALTRRAKI